MSDIYCRSAPENGTIPPEEKYLSAQNLNSPKKQQKLNPRQEETKRKHLEPKTKPSHLKNINIPNNDSKKNLRTRIINPKPLKSLKETSPRSKCSLRAPIGPLGADQCKCSSPHYLTHLLNQSEYELADDASKIQQTNANYTEEFELADDAISLNGEILEENNSRPSKEDNSYINVNGKEELPSPEQIKDNISPISLNKTDVSNINSDIKHDDFDGNRNKVYVPGQYSTLPKRKRNHVNHKMWYRPVLEPPHKVTPDGTDIYYWCDMPKRVEHGK